MKSVILFLTIFLAQCSSKQSSDMANNTNITNQKGVTQEEYQIKLKKVTADSRCPEGLNCVWEGQVEMIVAVYKADKLIEEKELIVNSQTVSENATWASKYSKKAITFIGVTPERIKDELINDSDYKLLIKYD
ncbi:hypothetical protein FIA58_008235 [Flavobacterium jejuense]|uniref:Lipoprotein n=1 Tax=Flavobacterium jejuense TaxID=1544455 RepID=A0ABX0IPC5_9FLAO|nr:hypothetical protein [Flavobacterium jejuense]NHN25664.1 hypothetical protein [Flavobacterium jejuense]